MSKANKFLIICAMLTGIGIVLCGVGTLLGGQVYGISFNRYGLQVYTPEKPSGNTDAPVYEHEEKTLEAFTSVNINVAFADVRIVKSDHYGIDYNNNTRNAFSYEVKDNVLHVNQVYNRSSGSSLIFTGFSLTGFSDYRGSAYTEPEYVTVYVPEEEKLDGISVSSEYGYTDISNITSSSIILSNEFGDIQLTHIGAEKITLWVDSGDIGLEDVTADDLTVDNGYGGCSLSRVSVAELTDIALESGSLTLDDTILRSLQVISNFGSIKGNAVTSETIILRLESGDCRIKELSCDTFEADSDYGDLSLSLTSPVDDYNYNLYTDYGDLRIDGMTQPSSYHSSVGTGSSIRINCESGDISISGT